MQPKTTTTAKRKAAPAKKKGEGASRPLPPMQRKALSKIEHVKSELASVYRQARARNLDVSDASRLANILAILARLIEGSDLEQRLEALEQQLGGTKA